MKPAVVSHRRVPAPAAVVAVVLLGGAFALAPALVPDGAAPAVLTAARAEPPLSTLDGDVTDRAGVLGDRTADVQAALDRVFDETEYQLFVVFTESFDGMDGLSWANATANGARLGPNDVLLAVATGERMYGLSIDPASSITDGQQDRIEAVTETALRTAANAPDGEGDWGAAAIAAADELIATWRIGRYAERELLPRARR